MIFIDIDYLKVYLNKPYIVIDAGKESEHFYFGGDYWDCDKKIFNDMEIGCSNAFLQTLEISQLSNTMWMPFDTPNFPKNMNSETVESFFNHYFMPLNMKELIDL